MNNSNLKKLFTKRNVVWFILMIVTLFMIMFPLYIMFKYSISDRSTWITGGKYPVPWWPLDPNFDMYKYYLSDSSFLRNALLSLEVALLTVVFSIAIGAPAAYALSRFKFKGKALFLVLVVAIRFIPDVTASIPVAYVFNNSFLYALPDIIKIALSHCLLSVPYVIFIAQGTFESIPIDLEEQVEIMGGSKAYAFFKIILPIAVPGLAAAAIYVFLLSWNEFVFSYFVTATSLSSVVPLPVYLKSLFGAMSPNQVTIATVSLLISLPVIIFTICLQKYIIAGMTEGAVK